MAAAGRGRRNRRHCGSGNGTVCGTRHTVIGSALWIALGGIRAIRHTARRQGRILLTRLKLLLGLFTTPSEPYEVVIVKE